MEGKLPSLAERRAVHRKQQSKHNDQVKAAIQGLTQAQRTVAQSQLQPILAAANLAEAELQQAQQTLRTAKAKTLTSKLAKAAFGKEGGEPQTPQDTDFFSEAISSTRDTTCDNAAGKNAKVKTIAAAVICLCSGAGTGSEKHACFKAPSLNADWSHTGDSTRTIWALLKPFCGGRSGKTLTADSLQTALEQVLNLIYAGSGAAFLGALETGATCTGANTAGMCIKFTGATTRSAEQITTSPWVAAISDAIQTLQAVEKAARQQAQATKTLRSLLESALATTAEAKQTKIENSITTDHQSTTKEKDCSTHKTNTTCTENKCKWEGTTDKDGKCTVDGSKVTTQTTATAGTGDGTAGTAASTGCASHFTDQKECEKMNEGKEKHVCAWKKGGEGDKDKDELRCRNGSFLVNNQFALLVS
uniref:Variant surface glycoprotein 1125.3114 n=1 Tax=Trypanosoma brucei TaxID=5691 RepID=A0A1J0R9T9_9TRYP|nr:variant surface glycoprotein 1125.3114 [Trypanosoma brucei]